MSFAPEHALVWTEIPVTDLDAGMAFYSTVFGYDLSRDESGPNPIAFLPTAGGPMGSGVAGHLYPGTPGGGAGPTVHLAIPDKLEDAVERLIAAGGKSDMPIVEMPFGRWAYATDPDGNSLGLFEAKS